MARARIDDLAGRDAVAAWREAQSDGPGGADGSRRSSGARSGSSAALDRNTLALAVRYTLQVLAEVAPGGTVEVRVPPFGAVQCIEGPRHTRGTPPNVVETDPATWLALATGRLAWPDARASGRVHASGQRADLEGLLPIMR